MLTVLLLKLSLTCGVLIPINSGCRSIEHNREVGGVENSKHLTCEAFDLGLHTFSKSQRYCVIKSAKQIFSRTLIYRSHIHVEE